MRIIHRRDGSFPLLFPRATDAVSDPAKLREAVRGYFAVGEDSAAVEVHDDRIVIEVADEVCTLPRANHKRVVRLAEQRRYAEAKQALTRLLARYPGASEAHRIHGQVLFDEG
jgi:hypothetical protein